MPEAERMVARSVWLRSAHAAQIEYLATRSGKPEGEIIRDLIAKALDSEVDK